MHVPETVGAEEHLIICLYVLHKVIHLHLICLAQEAIKLLILRALVEANACARDRWCRGAPDHLPLRLAQSNPPAPDLSGPGSDKVAYSSSSRRGKCMCQRPLVQRST